MPNHRRIGGGVEGGLGVRYSPPLSPPPSRHIPGGLWRRGVAVCAGRAFSGANAPSRGFGHLQMENLKASKTSDHSGMKIGLLNP